jgi:hypothetical protein
MSVAAAPAEPVPAGRSGLAVAPTRLRWPALAIGTGGLVVTACPSSTSRAG